MSETSQSVWCTESPGLPARVSLRVEMGGSFAVYLLDDEAGREGPARSTILRPADALAPARAVLLLVAELGESGRRRVMRVAQVGDVPLDLVRTDGRSRVGAGLELRSGARLEAAAEGRGPVAFALGLAAQSGAGLRTTVGAGGTRSSHASSAQAALLWVVPSVLQVIRDPLDDLKDGLFEWLRDSGISSRTFSGGLALFFTLMASGGFGVSQYFAAQDAEAALAAAQAESAAAAAGQQVALGAEAVCLVDRQAMAREAGDRELADRLALTRALERTAARARAVERGGVRFDTKEVAAFDADAFELDLRAARDGLEAARTLVEASAAAAESDAAGRCRAVGGALGDDLPAYALVVFPEPDRMCPPEYERIVEGTRLRGSWGLSDRALDELRDVARIEETAPVAGFDPRDVDRMGAALLGAGLREVRAALLGAELGVRPPVAPSELDLWSLALFEAANLLPPPAPGAPPRRLGDCVRSLVEAHAATQTTVRLGEPVLPAVATAAMSPELVTPTPTSSCAWPQGAVARGAARAIEAVSRQAVFGANEAGAESVAEEGG